MRQRSASNDFDACETLLRRGSKSFFAASRMLPRRLRRPVGAVYAFCRVADDAVDTGRDPAASLIALERRLDGIYGGRPADSPVDRALLATTHRYQLPKEAFLGLLEGFRWDVEERRYDTLEALREYCVRVASTVGVLMAVLMGERRPFVIARACDLGVAMQLTNIARDVGEDARAGRVYLPGTWLREVGLSPSDLVELPVYSPELGGVVRRVLGEAARLYRRAESGIGQLPLDCRPAIWAARNIYADIGRSIVCNGCDSVSERATTSRKRKAWLLAVALLATPRPSRPISKEPALPEAEFLVDAFLSSSP